MVESLLQPSRARILLLAADVLLEATDFVRVVVFERLLIGETVKEGSSSLMSIVNLDIESLLDSPGVRSRAIDKHQHMRLASEGKKTLTSKARPSRTATHYPVPFSFQQSSP